MKDFLIKVVSDAFQKTSVPVSVLLALWLLLSPSYNNFLQLGEKVEAHAKKFEKLDVIDDKLTTIMIELGIQKSKIKDIEEQYNNNKHHSEE
jgi:hypothetical protein